MNILELIKKNDPIVNVQELNSTTKNWESLTQAYDLVTKFKYKKLRKKLFLFKKYDESVVRGILLSNGQRIEIKDASDYWPYSANGVGYFLIKRVAKNNLKKVTLKETPISVSWVDNGVVLSNHIVQVDDNFSILHFPKIIQKASLVIEVVGVESDIFIGVHEVLNRSDVINLCKGTGYELGPGPKPQVLPNQSTKVNYVEQSNPEDWERLYGIDAKLEIDKSLWEHYQVGEAHNIPANENSLDFIFSSHVVEHLANPLGHFKYWSSLLKKNGVVVAVIPDAKSCKDYIFELSTISELEEEFSNEDMHASLKHYERWAKKRMPNIDPQTLLESRRSIHVHFYTPDSMSEIMRKWHKQLGFSSFQLMSKQNHKDFYLILTK